MELKQLDMEALLERAELEGVDPVALQQLSSMREPQDSVCRSVLEHRGLVPPLEPEPEPESEKEIVAVPTRQELDAGLTAVKDQERRGSNVSVSSIARALKLYGPHVSAVTAVCNEGRH